MTEQALIILAAGQGTRLQPYTHERPKCMVELAGQPLIRWQVAAARAAGLEKVVLVGGYQHEKLPADIGVVVNNPEFERTNMVASLLCAREHFGDGMIVAYGDIVYTPEVMQRLLAATGDIRVVIDEDWLAYWQARLDDPLSDAETLRIEGGQITEIGQKPSSLEEIQAQYIGLMAFQGAGLRALLDLCDQAQANHEKGDGQGAMNSPRPWPGVYMTDVLQALASAGQPLLPVPIQGDWLEIDTVEDLHVAEGLVKVEGNVLGIYR